MRRFRSPDPDLDDFQNLMGTHFIYGIFYKDLISFFQRYESNSGKMAYLAIMKNPSKIHIS